MLADDIQGPLGAKEVVEIPSEEAPRLNKKRVEPKESRASLKDRLDHPWSETPVKLV